MMRVCTLTLMVGTLIGYSIGCAHPADTAHGAMCSDQALAALKALYKKAAVTVVETGKCDSYTKVEDCPAYKLIEEDFKLAAKPWESCR